MLVRALAILFLMVAASYAATVYFGQEVLIALGLILVQLKVLGKKIISVELPSVLAWLKYETTNFFRIELLKKWLMTTALPLLVGRAALRRLTNFLKRYQKAMKAHYDSLLAWYGALDGPVKVIAALIVVFAALALSVSSIGLWLILFSVKLPFWVLATVTSLGQMFWLSVRKMAFKTVAFLQLGWLWRIVRKRLPEKYLEKKRRFDFRVARSVVRRRRMTVKQLAARKDSLSMKWAVLSERWRQRDNAPENQSSTD